MKILKYSRQRDAIKSALGNRVDHPTADTLYRELRGTDPKISLGTVYRNLHLLSDRGEVLKITDPEGIDHFDWNTSLHAHFICGKCGRVMDIPDADINFSLSDDVGRPDTIVIYGICKMCNK